METTTTTTSKKKSGTPSDKNEKLSLEAVEEQVEHVGTALQERVAEARDIVEDLRDRAEMAIHERPYIVPVAAGAVGLGVGILIGSKLSRMIAVGVAGALLSDTVRTQLFALGKDVIARMGEDDSEDIEEPTTSTV